MKYDALIESILIPFFSIIWRSFCESMLFAAWNQALEEQFTSDRVAGFFVMVKIARHFPTPSAATLPHCAFMLFHCAQFQQEQDKPLDAK